MRSALWAGLVVLSACGASEPAPPVEGPPPTPEGCEHAADCHYDDECMPRACQLAPPESLDCDETVPPAGPCVCVERRCEMQLPEPVAPPDPEPEPEPEASCASAADCYFDSPCAPSACTTEAPPEDLACAESWPARGECRCLAGRCAMQRFEPTRSETECSASSPCGFDLATGTCLPSQADESAPVPASGARPVCRCRDSHCVGGWITPVACTTAEDCWVEEGPLGAVPIARPRARRRRPFRPCVDGEVAPDCVGGFCALSMLRYGC